jgi:hypothetical protein
MSLTRITRDELLAIACKYWGAEVPAPSIQVVPKLNKEKKEIPVPVTIYSIKYKDKDQKDKCEADFNALFETKGAMELTFKECFSQLVLERRQAFKQFHNGEQQDVRPKSTTE